MIGMIKLGINIKKKENKKAWAAYGKQYKGRYYSYGKYGHKSTDSKYPENTKNQKEKEKKNIKTHLMANVTIGEVINTELVNVEN